VRKTEVSHNNESNTFSNADNYKKSSYSGFLFFVKSGHNN